MRDTVVTCSQHHVCAAVLCGWDGALMRRSRPHPDFAVLGRKHESILGLAFLAPTGPPTTPFWLGPIRVSETLDWLGTLRVPSVSFRCRGLP